MEFNTDLPNVFDSFEYTPTPEDLGHELVWYVDPAFFPDRCRVWTLKTGDKGIKRMGYVTPNLSKQLDVVFLSYDELNADENYQRLKTKFTGNVHRVNGVKGIFEAHKAAAELCSTDMFYVVDADAWILDSWNFNFTPTIFDRNYIHIFQSRNPVNGLEYGNGGVKIFPKNCFDRTPGVDVSTSLAPVKLVNLTVCENRFNTSPFNCWRAGFREGAKLASGVIKNQNFEETYNRLVIWTTVGDDYTVEGAKAGEKFIKAGGDISLINNFEWLKEQYESSI